MTDQKPKRGGYVLPRNVTQGPPGYTLLPKLPLKRPEAKPVEPAIAAPDDPDPQAGSLGLSPQEVAGLYLNPQFSDEELLLCRHMLFFTADGGNDAPPEVMQLAAEAIAKIDTALQARHANDVPDPEEHARRIAEARASVPPIQPPKTPGTVPEIEGDGRHTGRYVLWEASEVNASLGMPKYFAAYVNGRVNLFLFEGTDGVLVAYKAQREPVYTEPCRDHGGAMIADPSVGQVVLPAALVVLNDPPEQPTAV
jgi:hypothetical protein